MTCRVSPVSQTLLSVLFWYKAALVRDQHLPTWPQLVNGCLWPRNVERGGNNIEQAGWWDNRVVIESQTSWTRHMEEIWNGVLLQKRLHLLSLNSKFINQFSIWKSASVDFLRVFIMLLMSPYISILFGSHFQSQFCDPHNPVPGIYNSRWREIRPCLL